MALENSALPPQTEDTLRLIETHRQLTGFNGFAFAQEQDTYSLAQPSPFRFVPTVASNGAATLMQGE
ncbi:hypothetical protein [Acidicapsa acidisoli]|uniref:hypothetical protein n=1 Tax=Acidicapsa acidisoli TaxID=1615681 RepID=UPI0021E0A9C1|nr:hypothetical protein [Acidicapsa acidisoli]